MEKNITIQTAPGADLSKPIIVHLLEGDAPKPLDYVPLSITGDINAVKDFVDARKEYTDKCKDDFHILFNTDRKTISLHMHPQHPVSTTVFAHLTTFTDLAAFGINRDTKFTLDAVRKLIRTNRIYFASKDNQVELLTQLQNFSATITSEILNTKDTRGNSNVGFNKKVTTGLAAEFILCIPVFTGLKPATIRVEICYDVTDGSTSFWFESVELFEIEKQTIEDIFTAQMAEFKNYGYTIINQ